MTSAESQSLHIRGRGVRADGAWLPPQVGSKLLSQVPRFKYLRGACSHLRVSWNMIYRSRHDITSFNYGLKVRNIYLWSELKCTEKVLKESNMQTKTTKDKT